MMLIPLQAAPSQTLAVTLDRQNTQLAVRQNDDALYLDLLLDETPIVLTRICRDRQRLLLDAKYRGFAGDFVFIDTQGTTDPQFAGLGSRFLLIFLSAGE